MISASQTLNNFLRQAKGERHAEAVGHLHNGDAWLRVDDKFALAIQLRVEAVPAVCQPFSMAKSSG